jgi:hypothetical protein
MKFWIGTVLGAAVMMQPAYAQSALKVVYPPTNHETASDRIFLIGTAPASAVVTVNGQIIGDRSGDSPGGQVSIAHHRLTTVVIFIIPGIDLETRSVRSPPPAQ